MTQHIHLLSNSRSGSSYLYYALREYINPTQPWSSKQPISSIEPFNLATIKQNFPTWEPVDLIEKRLELLENATRPNVIKNHSNHMYTIAEKFPGFYSRFKKLDLHTIALVRQNLFETVLSEEISRHTYQYKHYFEEFKNFEIDPKQFAKTIQMRAMTTNDLVGDFHKFGYNEILMYEDLTFDPLADYVNRGLCRTAPEILPWRTVNHFVEAAPDKRNIVANYKELLEVAIRELQIANKEHTTNNIEIQGVTITRINNQ